MQPNQQNPTNQTPLTPEEQQQLKYMFAEHLDAAPIQKSHKKLGVIITLIVVLFCGIGAAVVILMSSKPDSKPAEIFISALKESDYAAAYNQFTTELMGVQSIKQFVAQFSSDDVLIDESCSLTVSENTLVTINGQEQQGITGKIVCDAKTYDAQFVFVDQEGANKLFSYRINPQIQQ